MRWPSSVKKAESVISPRFALPLGSVAERGTTVVLVGTPELIVAADLVTEMSEIKNPFTAGIRAQQGIEF